MSRAIFGGRVFGARHLGGLFLAFSALAALTIAVLMERACAAPARRPPLFAQCGLAGQLFVAGDARLAARETREGRSAAVQSRLAARPIVPGLLAFDPRPAVSAAAFAAASEPGARYCPTGAPL